MIATGSIDGSPYCTSLVATAFTQSVEPGSGTSSTLIPASRYQPILVAIANGAAADETVFAHQATRTVVCACTDVANAPSTIAESAKERVMERVRIVRCISPSVRLTRPLSLPPHR